MTFSGKSEKLDKLLGRPMLSIKRRISAWFKRSHSYLSKALNRLQKELIASSHPSANFRHSQVRK